MRPIAAALACLISSGVAWAEEPKASVATKPVTQVGDYWHYDTRDDITGTVVKLDYIVTDMTPKSIAVRVKNEDKPDPAAFMTCNPAWGVIKRGRWSFQPSDGTEIPQRLVVGESWSFEGDSIDSISQRARRRRMTSKITDRETLTTKAGKFDTYRIETSWNARDTLDPTLRFNYEQTTWYAPAVNHWVKRTYSFRTDGLLREQTTQTLTAWGHGQNK